MASSLLVENIDLSPSYNNTSKDEALHHRELLGLQENRTMTIDEAIDLIGIGRFQHEILFSSGMCFAADAIEVTLLSFLAPVLKLEWGLTSNEAASVTSCVFAGALLGTLVLGPMGDKVGRRPVFLLAATVIALFGFLTVLTNSFVPLLLVRTVVGFGVGGLTAPFDLLLEVLPTQERGKYLLWIEFFWSAGSVVVPLLAWVTIGAGRSWKWFVFACAVPCVLSVLSGLFLVPESPRWLLEVGRTDEAMDVLRRAATSNGKNPDELFPLAHNLLLVVTHESGHGSEEHQQHAGLSQLLSPTWRGLFLSIWMVWFGFAFAYYGTIQVVTRIFEITGTDANNDNIADFDYLAIVISSSAEIAGLLFVLLTIDRWGRIPTQMMFYGLGGISVFALCYCSWLSPSILTAIAFLARSFEMGASCVTWVSTPEMLPTELRSTGHSSANAVSRIGAFVSPYIVQGDLDLVYVGWIFLFVHLFTVFATSRLPETAGKSLGEVKEEQKRRQQDRTLFVSDADAILT